MTGPFHHDVQSERPDFAIALDRVGLEDVRKRVDIKRKDGSVIRGLYAAGNNSASVMGRTYPGPGATIGPAMVFGMIAGRHAAAVTKSQPA